MDTVEQVKEKIRRLKNFLARCKEVEDKSFAATKELSTEYQKLTDVLSIDRNLPYKVATNGYGNILISGGSNVTNEISLSSTKANIETAISIYRQQLADLEGY